MANQGWPVPGWLPIDPLNASSLTPSSIQLDSTSFSPADYEETQDGIPTFWLSESILVGRIFEERWKLVARKTLGISLFEKSGGMGIPRPPSRQPLDRLLANCFAPGGAIRLPFVTRRSPSGVL